MRKTARSATSTSAKRSSTRSSVPPVTVASAILLPGQAGYANTEDALYPYSKDKAQAALKAAGYRIQNGQAMKGG